MLNCNSRGVNTISLSTRDVMAGCDSQEVDSEMAAYRAIYGEGQNRQFSRLYIQCRPVDRIEFAQGQDLQRD